MGTMSKRAGIYCRISLDAEGEGLGVARQEADCRARAEHLGWQVAQVYTDNDISATKGKERPSYRRMLDDLEAGVIDAVVVYSLDRLTRRPVELEAFIDLVERRGVAVSNIAGDVDLLTANGRMVARIMGSVARGEVDRMGERIKRQKEQRAEQGKKQGGRYRVYGYDRAWNVLPAEAAVVKEAFTRKAQGESISAIAHDFNGRGLKTVAGNAWSAASMGKLLSKPEYAGQLRSNGVVVGKTAFDAIIDLATYTAANDAMAQVARKGNNARRHLLSGFLVCSKCLNTMKGNGAKPSYRCPSIPGACGACSIKMPDTDAAVFNAAWRKEQDAPVKPKTQRDYKGEAAGIEDEIKAVRESDLAVIDKVPMIKDLRARLAAVLKQAAADHDLGVMQIMVDFEDMNLSQKRLWLSQYVTNVIVYPPTQGARAGFDVRRLEVHYTDGSVERLSKPSNISSGA